MKKILCFLLIFVLCLGGCAEKKASDGGEDKLNICTTIFPQYDFARSIAGDKAEVCMLLPPGSESHTYEPTPQDIVCIQESDIFIYTGGESDSWIDGVLETIDTENMQIISLMDIFDEGLYEPEDPDGEHSHSHKADEHVWTSPKNALVICDEIFSALKRADMKNSSYYNERYAEYKKELEELDIRFTQLSENAVRKTVVFADRFPFKYLAEDYGLTYYSAYAGCAEETEPSITAVAGLIDRVKSEKIPVVFYLEFSNRALADTVAAETGAKPLMLHSCHNVTADELDGGITYIELMRRNTQALEEALYK